MVAAVMLKKLRKKKYHPDLALYQSQGGFFGLFLELKKQGVRLKKKNGQWASPQIAGQAEYIADLRERGYCAEFAVGFDDAKEIIDYYMKLRIK